MTLKNKQKEIMLGLLALVLLTGIIWFGSRKAAVESARSTDESALYFNGQVISGAILDIGWPKEGFTPDLLMRAYPGLAPSDFEGVAAQQGVYRNVEGDVQFVASVSIENQNTASQAITDAGMKTLLENIGTRLRLPVKTNADVDAIMATISIKNDESSNSTSTVPQKDTDGGYVCTMEAKLCPDGSSVGRSGPRCEFAKCPGETSIGYHTCPDEWIVNKMPSVGESAGAKDYFIIDGHRFETSQFDMNWVKNNCSVSPQEVY